MRHGWFVTAVMPCLAVAGLMATSTRAAEQPNIVFIMADDLGWGDVGFHDGPTDTPHLDQLAKSGVELTQHYVAPVCSPTRSALLSGRYWSRFGVTTPTNSRAYPWDTVTLPRALKSVGYDTAITGKWHLGSLPDEGPRKYGFDHSYGSLAGGVGPWNHVYKTGPFSETWHRDDTRIAEAGHVTDLITREAVQWIETRSEKPFFLYVPFTAVHLPIKEPREWLDRVPPTLHGDVPRQYAACVMHLDDAVGRIVSAVAAAGKRTSTLIVFTSDNGGSWAENNDTKYAGDVYAQGKLVGRNEPLRGQKGQLYEGGIRVPTVVSWPERLTAAKIDAPVHIADWMPTFCTLAGYAPENDLKWDGQDIWPLVTGQLPAGERPLYWAGGGFKSQAVRVGDWKLIVQNAGQTARYELFNLEDDPYEENDRSETTPDVLARLVKTLATVSANDRDAVANDGH